MKKSKLTRLIASMLLVASMLVLNPTGVSASWKQDGTGWWYTEGTSWSTGWRNIDGIWYYFYTSGYMAHDTTIEGYVLNSNGAWVTNAIVNSKSDTNNTTNNNTNTNTNNTNTGNFINANSNENTDTIINTHSANNNKNITNNEKSGNKIKINNTNSKNQIKVSNDTEKQRVIDKLKEQIKLWENDNSAFSEGKIRELQAKIYELENQKS